MVSVALRGEFLEKRQPAKPSMSLFFNCLLSHSDTGFRIYVKNWLDWYQGHLLKRFLRRAVAHQSSKKNFGPNVRYCFLGYIFALSFWLTKYHVTSHYLALRLCNIHSFLRMNPSCYKNRKAAAMIRNMVLSDKKGGARD